MKISEIIIPDDRIRTPRDISDLQASMALLGQLQPIVVSHKVLVFGHRRLLAAKALGWEEINAVDLANLTDEQMLSLEIEENTQRQQMSWQETAQAILRLNEQTDDISLRLGMPLAKIERYLDVAQRAASDPTLWECKTLREAYERPSTKFKVDLGQPKPKLWPEFASGRDAGNPFTFAHFNFHQFFREYFDVFISNAHSLMARDSICVFWCRPNEMFRVAATLQKTSVFVHPEPLIMLHEPLGTPKATFPASATFGVVCTSGELREIPPFKNYAPSEKYHSDFYPQLIGEHYNDNILEVDHQQISARATFVKVPHA